jgi:hypothetical protein
LSGLLEGIESAWLPDGRENWIPWVEAVQSVSGKGEVAVLDLLESSKRKRMNGSVVGPVRSLVVGGLARRAPTTYEASSRRKRIGHTTDCRGIVVSQSNTKRTQNGHIRNDTRDVSRRSSGRSNVPICRKNSAAGDRVCPRVTPQMEKEYRFDTDDGEKPLVELFDGRSQLLVYP